MQHDVLLIAGPFFAVVEVGTIVFRYIQLRAQLTCRRLSFLRRRNTPFGSFATSGTAIRRNARIIHLELRVVGLLLRSCATRQRARQSSGGKYPYQSHALSFQPNGASRRPAQRRRRPFHATPPRAKKGRCLKGYACPEGAWAGASIGLGWPREQLKPQRVAKVRFTNQQTLRPATSFNSNRDANHSEPGQLPFRQPYQARNISMQGNGDQPYFLRSTPSSAFTKSNAASIALSIS